jgi:hypothetical protein
MALIAICLTLEFEFERLPLKPEARLWVDLEPERALDTETEVALTCHDHRSWRGAFTVPERQLGSFTYRVGLYAHAGAAWSLVFRNASWRGDELLADADLLGSSKAWFTGTCNLHGRRSRNPGAKRSPSGGRSGPVRLVLLDPDRGQRTGKRSSVTRPLLRRS